MRKPHIMCVDVVGEMGGPHERAVRKFVNYQDGAAEGAPFDRPAVPWQRKPIFEMVQYLLAFLPRPIVVDESLRGCGRSISMDVGQTLILRDQLLSGQDGRAAPASDLGSLLRGDSRPRRMSVAGQGIIRSHGCIVARRGATGASPPRRYVRRGAQPAVTTLSEGAGTRA